MAKTKISEYSSTANSNTDIASINIDEGCAPSGINNAIRALMAQLKDFQTGAASDPVTVGGVLTVTGGSAAAPAITTSGDTNTGVLFPAADTVGITTGGTERVRVDSSGNVGIGATPSAWYNAGNLQVGSYAALYTNSSLGAVEFTSNTYRSASSTWNYVAANYASRYQQYDGTHRWYTAASGSVGGTVSWTESMRIDSSGNVGIGTSSPSYRLDVQGNGDVYAHVRNNTSGSGAARLLLTNNGDSGFGIINNSGASGVVNLLNYKAAPMAFWTDSVERMRIDTSGNLLVGTTDASVSSGVGFKMRPAGDGAGYARFDTVTNASTNGTNVTYTLYSTGAGAHRFYVGAGGTVFATNTTISSLSDQRFKENIRDLDAGLAKVMALKPRLYDWKEGKGANIKNARGFIAQEFEIVFPDLIDEWQDKAPEGEEPYKSVRQDLIPVLVKAIQEQQAIITQLQADVAALKGQ